MVRRSFQRLVGGILISGMLSFGVAAQQSDIEATISDQIAAFKADDFATAFGFATPRLQQLFQSPENFERMVIGGYPMVWRPAEVRYLELREHAGAMWQKVQIIDAKGFAHILVYRMEQTPQGWRIGGVQVLKQPGATV